MSKKLRFVLKMNGDFMGVMRALGERFMPNGERVLNRTEWRGKEPRSCAITGVSTRTRSAGDKGPIIVDVEVTYRPKGYISYTGNTKYDGWTAMVLDESADPPIWVPHEVYDDVEFNDLDFGEFVGESDAEGVKHVTMDAVMSEIMESGKFSASVHSSFMAPHRSRPQKKIILSGQPTGELIDGFGTRVLNIDNATPDLERVVMEKLTELMCDFIEGRISIKCIGNDNLTFVELSDSLVDCAPNEDGMDSFFDILHLQTPAGFLEELAKRLMSVYAVDVAVVDGERCGLVLRREARKE